MLLGAWKTRLLTAAALPQLRAVASLKDWPDGICGFEQTGKRRFEMSWTGANYTLNPKP